MTCDITTFGEAMLRLSVPEGTRLQATNSLDVHPAGAEANLITLLARLGRRCAWHSALPDNPLGRLIADHLRQAGVDVSSILWKSSGRVGTYYVEFAAPPRVTQVIYDRADSCVTRVTPDDLHWDSLLDTRLVHLTGITPALSPSCADVIRAIIERAHQAGIPISFDVNYRQKLWSEAEARDWLTPVIQGADLLFCGQGDAGRVFGIDGTPENAIKALAELSGATKVIMSIGDQGAVGWNGTQLYHVTAPAIQMIDRLGAGDALAAGVIHAWLDSGDLALGLRYGTVLAAMALTQRGDAVMTTPEELAAMVEQAHGGSSILR